MQLRQPHRIQGAAKSGCLCVYVRLLKSLAPSLPACDDYEKCVKYIALYAFAFLTALFYLVFLPCILEE